MNMKMFQKFFGKLAQGWKENAYANDCAHIDYTDTLDGAVCNDCGAENLGERDYDSEAKDEAVMAE